MSEPPSIDVDHELRRLDQTLAELEALRPAEGEGDQGAHAPAVSGWGVAQHLYHIALATDLSLGHVRRLLAGSGALVRAEGALEPEAAEVLGREQQPRGVAEAPRMVRPADRVEPAFLAQEQAGNRAVYEELAAAAGDIAAAPGWIPHQELGPMQAGHWLRFAVLHARHHLAIARDVIAAS